MRKLVLLTIILIFTLCACTPGSQTGGLYFHDTKNGKGYSEDNKFYFTKFKDGGTSLIMCADYKSKTVYPLCYDEQCAHADESCTAWYADSVSGLDCVPYNGKLYIFPLLIRLSDVTGPVKISVREADGQNRQDLAVFEPNQFIASHLVFDEDNIYLILYEEIGWLDHKEYLVSVSLNDGKITTLYASQNTGLRIVGVGKDGIILSYSHDVGNDTVRKLHLYNISQKTMQEIRTVDIGEELYFEDGNLFICNEITANISMLDTKTLEETEKVAFAQPESNWNIRTEYVFDNYLIYSVFRGANMEIFIYNMETKQTSPFNLYMSKQQEWTSQNFPIPFFVVDSYKDYYIVNNSWGMAEFKNPLLDKTYYGFRAMDKQDLINSQYNIIEFEDLQYNKQ